MPEQIPDGLQPLTTFRFDAGAAKFATDDMELQIDALETRIERVVDKCKIGDQGFPVIGAILNLTHNQEELELLARGLLKVAKLVGPLDDLKKRQQVLELARENPTWFAWAFGDFNQSVDEAIEQILES